MEGGEQEAEDDVVEDEDVVGEGESGCCAATVAGVGERSCCIASLHSLVVTAEQPEALTSSSSSSFRSRLSSSRSLFRIVDLFSDSVTQDGAAAGTAAAVEKEKSGGFGFGFGCCLRA